MVRAAQILALALVLSGCQKAIDIRYGLGLPPGEPASGDASGNTTPPGDLGTTTVVQSPASAPTPAAPADPTTYVNISISGPQTGTPQSLVPGG